MRLSNWPINALSARIIAKIKNFSSMTGLAAAMGYCWSTGEARLGALTRLEF